MKRAAELGWPNTYTLTKSLAESLIAKYGAGLPIAVVRPAIVETSVGRAVRRMERRHQHFGLAVIFAGNLFPPAADQRTEAAGYYPSGLGLPGHDADRAAIVERRHEPLYQLATSVTNPCDMRRSIELTSLAHRKHYRAQEGLEYWLRLRLDAIPVSKERYNRMSAPAQKAIVKSIQRDHVAAAFEKDSAGARRSAAWKEWKN